MSIFLHRHAAYMATKHKEPVEAPAETKSTHKAEVVPVKLEPHPNADTLSLVKIWGYQVVVKTADWKDQSAGVYIVPDSVVPDHPYFAFLNGGEQPLREKDRRITTRRFRGQLSEGLLISLLDVRKNWPESRGGLYSYGDDAAPVIGITRYEAPEPGTNFGGGAGHGRGLHHFDNEPGPTTLIAPVYDIESWQRYGAEVFQPGERVHFTEKIDGTNFRAVFNEGKFHVGSHRTWKRQELPPLRRRWEELQRFLDFILMRPARPKRLPTDVHSRAARMYEGIRTFCEDHPDHVIYGEIWGDVPNGSGARYGCEASEIHLAVFDIRLPGGDYMHPGTVRPIMVSYGVPLAPEIYDGPYSDEVVRRCMNGPSVMHTPTLREGIVIRACGDKTWIPGHGRKILKAVSPEFLEKYKSAFQKEKRK